MIDPQLDDEQFDSPREEVLDAAWRLNGVISSVSGVDAQRVLEHVAAIHCSKMGSKDGAIIVANGLHKHILQLIDDIWEGDWRAWKDDILAWPLPRTNKGGKL